MICTASPAPMKMRALSVVLFLAVVCLTPALEKRTVPANGAFAGRKNYNDITVANGGPWGYWTWIDMCPEQSYAIGFDLKVETLVGLGDDTSVNGIRLFCSSNHTGSIMFTVESDVEEHGVWTGIRWCPKDGVLIAFQLRVEPPQGLGDDTAVNNIKFRCSNGAVIEGQGEYFGDYDAWSNSCTRGGICGIQTNQEPYGGFFVDDTALNDVRFFCCE